MSDSTAGQLVDTVPIEDLRPIDVLTTAANGDLALRGSRCPACAKLAFPPRTHCNNCLSGGQEDVLLPTEGELYAFSTVHVSSSQPVPYTLGFVDLPGDLRVLGRMFGAVAELNIGDSVSVAAESVDGNETWGFRKV